MNSVAHKEHSRNFYCGHFSSYSLREQILSVSSCVELEQMETLLVPEAYILEVRFETVPRNVTEACLEFTCVAQAHL